MILDEFESNLYDEGSIFYEESDNSLPIFESSEW